VAGYDEEPEEVAYHIWRHEGRRYLHGALMMAAGCTQWHDIWDLQHDLIDIIRYGVEHGVPEAEAWMASDDPVESWLYPYCDLPGSAWGIDTVAYRKSDEHTTKIWANREGGDDYWDNAFANVEAAYEHGLLSDDQWELVEAVCDDTDRQNGDIFDLPALYEIHMEGKAADVQAAQEQVLELELPGPASWQYER
jgi:hypothetical protein